MEDIVRLIHEAGSLKLLPRSGWLKLGIKLPESVADHSFRTALIAFILVLKSERNNNKAFKAATAALFHDLHEARTMDLHKIAREYVRVNESKAIEDQISILGFKFDFSDVEEYLIDADKLELAFQAVEYASLSSDAIEFAENIELKTDVAKRIYKILMSRRDPKWWK